MTSWLVAWPMLARVSICATILPQVLHRTACCLSVTKSAFIPAAASRSLCTSSALKCLERPANAQASVRTDLIF